MRDDPREPTWMPSEDAERWMREAEASQGTILNRLEREPLAYSTMLPDEDDDDNV